jgi:branched-chain amino acid transport system permease protein
MALIQALINGLLVGGVYAIASLGLTLVFGIMRIVNFAQATFLMMGMYIAYFVWLYLGLDPLAGSLIAFAAVFLLGALVQRMVVTPILQAPQLSQVFLTVGLLIILENGALVAFGSELRSVHTPYQTSAIQLGGLFISVPYLAAFAISLIAGTVLYLFLERTRLGRAIRATAQNPVAARLVGIDTSRMYSIAFGLGTGLTALGGAVILPYGSAFPTVGDQYVLLMFTAVVLGGLGNVLGALAGGLVVGLVQSVSALVLPIQMQNLMLFMIFIAVLVWRPTGLLGRGG